MKWSFLLLLFLGCVGCEKSPKHSYTFYYWKTNFNLTKQEKEALKKSDSPYLYMRFFDVDRVNGKLQPLASISSQKKLTITKEIVPVVYITNRCLLNITTEELSLLANGIHQLIQKKNAQIGNGDIREIQIDCDWTSSTREDYFTFLNILQDISGKEITCTLRLHQVRDRAKTGVPPVNKVYLMCYSTSSPLENSDENSILHIPTLKNYLGNLDSYPITNVAIALPIYSWGIVKNHLGKHQLINALNTDDLKNANFKNLNANEVLVQKDGFYFGFYLNKGFSIKVESITDEQLNETIKFLNSKLINFDIVYYHLDERFLTQHKFKNHKL